MQPLQYSNRTVNVIMYKAIIGFISVLTWGCVTVASGQTPIERNRKFCWRDCDLIVVATAEKTHTAGGWKASIEVPAGLSEEMVVVKRRFSIERVLWGEIAMGVIDVEYLVDNPESPPIFSKVPVIDFRSGSESIRSDAGWAGRFETKYLMYLRKTKSGTFTFAYGLENATDSVNVVFFAH